jgi:hypothetical protein
LLSSSESAQLLQTHVQTFVAAEAQGQAQGLHATTAKPPCAVNRGRIQLGHFFSRPIVSSHSLLTASFKLSEPLSASLPGSLAASVALGSARLDFEATPVVDADHGESESRSRRRRGRRCGLWKQHMGNGVAPEGICAACRARSIRRSQLVG